MIDFLIISQKRSGTNIILSYLRSKITVRWINGCDIIAKKKYAIKPGIRKVGLIIQGEHLNNKHFYNELINQCNQNTKVIVNYREDLLLTYASLKIAETTGHWVFFKSKVKIPFNKTEFNKFKIDFLAQRTQIKNFLLKRQLIYKTVTYEQFLINRKQVIRNIYDFFNIKHPYIIYNTFLMPKQEKRSLAEIFI